MVKISACVITKNEADTIARCLQSVKGAANELIVVDTGSSDDTVNIARQMGAKVFYFQWNNDFAAARNYALRQAKGDWIIFLDADEYIREDKVQNVRPVIEEAHANGKIESVVCLMENTEGYNGALRGSNPTLRIFRNSRLIRYEGRIHETISKNGQSVSAAKDENQLIVVRHTGYTRESISEKLLRNTKMLEEELNRGVIRDLTYHYLSYGYWKFGQYEKAIQFAHQALDHVVTGNNVLAYKPYLVLMDSMLKLGYSEEAIDAVREQAVQKHPHHPEVLAHQGFCFMASGRYHKALDSLLQSVEENAHYNDLTLSNEFFGLTNQVHLNIARIYNFMNESVKAFDFFYKALEHDKYNQEAFRGLISLIKEQAPAEIVFFLNRLYHEDDQADIDFLVKNLSKLKMKMVLGYYQKIRSEQFGHDEYGGLVLLSNGRFEEAFRYFAASFRETGDAGVELLVVASLLLGGEQGWLDSLESLLKPSFKRIVTAFFSDKAVDSLDAEDFLDYLDLITNFAGLCSQEQLERFLNLGKRFAALVADETYIEIGDALAKQDLFRPAFDMYLYPIQATGSTTDWAKAFYCKAGYCCYKLKDYQGAAECFTRALEAGYRGKDIFEFLEWSAGRCGDGGLEDKLHLLKQSYENN